MFTDIVTSTDLVGLIGDEAWAELLHWHDRELRSAIAQHRGEDVNHTGDGFFVAFERAVDSVECAVEIQRRLSRHRRDHGFAPRVQIGLHTAEATREGRGYLGRGSTLLRGSVLRPQATRSSRPAPLPNKRARHVIRSQSHAR